MLKTSTALLALAVLCAPSLALAQNVLLPQDSSKTLPSSATSPSVSVTSTSSQTASPPAPAASSNSQLPAQTTSTTTGAAATVKPVSTPLDSWLSQKNNNQTTTLTYLPANVQAIYAQAEMQKVNMVQQAITNLQQSGNSSNDQQLASLNAQLVQYQKRLSILQGGSLKVSDLVSLYSSQ